MRKFMIAALMGLFLAAPVSARAADEAAAKKAPAEKTATAAPATVARIAVVDVQGLVASSKAGKSIQAQIEKQRESFKTEFASLEKDLGDMQKKLSEDKTAKDSKEFETKRKEFETKMMNANKLVQERRQALEQGANDAVLQLRKKIVEIVADIADQEKFTIVIGRQDVVLAEKDMDITEKVLARLDKDLPDVKLKLDTAKAAPAAAAPTKQ